MIDSYSTTSPDPDNMKTTPQNPIRTVMGKQLHELVQLPTCCLICVRNKFNVDLLKVKEHFQIFVENAKTAQLNQLQLIGPKKYGKIFVRYSRVSHI